MARDAGTRLVTVVVGAGPAGLLFCIAGRLLAARAGLADAWTIRLLDKRGAYARTHRLRMAEPAYEELAGELDDPRVDELVAFLRESGFAPEVNHLEERLAGLAAELGVIKRRCAVGDGAGETSLAALRRDLEEEGLLPPAAALTIVGADSVHSAVRALAAPGSTPERHQHEQLVRLHVDGDDLPPRLGTTDTVRVSKLLGSLVDYRLNANGFAEVDLFLDAREHARARALGATPSTPVDLGEATLRELGAPLLAGVVRWLARGDGGASRRVRLMSTFALEHAVAPRRVLAHEPAGAVVALVGDAAVSLPFQRGMSCLARSALALAQAHVAELQLREVDAAVAPLGADERTPEAVAARAARFAPYDVAVDAIVRSELAVVRSRARLVRALRESIRLASLLPFPVQSWLFPPPRVDPREDATSGWHVVNVAFATATAILALGGSILRVGGWEWGALSAWGAIALESGGGFLYRGTLELVTGPTPRLRRIWQVQLVLVFLGGVGITAWASWRAGVPTHVWAALWSLRLAGAFVIGLYLCEVLITRLARSADLDDPAGRGPPR